VATPEPTSTGRRGPELRKRIAASELSSWGGRAQRHGTRGSTGTRLDRKARFGAQEHVAASELNSARRRDPGPRGSTEAHLSEEVSSGAAGHVTAQEPTSAGRCGPKL
jgi:hypothetical protein